MLTGGLRDRMIIESVGNAVVDQLTTLGWFDAGRYHAAITVVDEFPDITTPVQPNTLAISSADTRGAAVEMGSTTQERSIGMFFDFFAESDALARHLIGDIFDFVWKAGRFAVYDYSVATPTLEFYAVLNEQTLDQREPENATNSWQTHWKICSFAVEDER